MFLKIINELPKQLTPMDVKIFYRAWLISRIWRFLFCNRETCLQRFTGVFLVILLFSIGVGCSQKRGIASQPKHQSYQDVTESYLPSSKISLQGATFVRADRKPGSDLIWFISTPGKGAKIKILLNRGTSGIGRDKGAVSYTHLTLPTNREV